MRRASVLLLSISLVAHAQEPRTPSLTLEQALAWAREHQPQVRAALAELAARKSEARVPRAQWFPTLGASAELI